MNKCKKITTRWMVISFGRGTRTLRFAFGYLALRSALPLGGAPLPLKTPTPRCFLYAASSPFERWSNKKPPGWVVLVWWGWRGSNPRPLRCERSALTNWATSPRKRYFTVSGSKWQALFRCFAQVGLDCFKALGFVLLACGAAHQL